MTSLMAWLVAGFGGLLAGIALIRIRHACYDLARKTVSLADTLLAREPEEVLQPKILAATGSVLISLVRFLVGILLVLGLASLPFWLWYGSGLPPIPAWPIGGGGSIGLLLAYLGYARWRPRSTYPELSVLLHHLILDNPNLGMALFRLDQRLHSAQLPPPEPHFVIVSGLARAGTTALTQSLARSGPFASLTYANMPLLLAPNLWRRIYRPKAGGHQLRLHQDRLTHDWNSVEALEEYFFKACLQDQYIGQDTLLRHDIPEDVLSQYLRYQASIRKTPTQRYLAKNNNLLLRYASLRAQHPAFTAIFLFRAPIAHAASLRRQHRHFSQLQQEDPFILTYMDWLGHHEFGLHHKRFVLSEPHEAPPESPDQLAYWVRIWVQYYRYLLSQDLSQSILIAQEDLAQHPQALLHALGARLDIPLAPLPDGPRSVDENLPEEALPSVPTALRQEAESVYASLCARKLRAHP